MTYALGSHTTYILDQDNCRTIRLGKGGAKGKIDELTNGVSSLAHSVCSWVTDAWYFVC